MGIGSIARALLRGRSADREGAGQRSHSICSAEITARTEKVVSSQTVLIEMGDALRVTAALSPVGVIDGNASHPFIADDPPRP